MQDIISITFGFFLSLLIQGRDIALPVIGGSPQTLR